MKKILLINPGHDNEHELNKHQTHRTIHRDPPPVALLYVATYLSEHGYGVDIIDTHVEEDYINLIKNKVLENDYLFIGITVIIGKFLKNAKELTNLIREIKSKTPIVWGGIMSSVFPEECLKQYNLDYVIRFEGEETSLELAKALENNSPINDINGLSYVKEGKIINNPARIPKINLDELPIPRWNLFGSYFNKEQTPYYYLIMSSKGCPFNCKFCYKHSIDKEIRTKVPPWRKRSYEHIIKEIEYIHNNTGTKVFSFGDDNFCVDKQRVLKILEYFKEKGFYIEEAISHLNCIDDELIEAMGGIVQTLICSVETASPRLQKNIDKRVNLESVPAKIKKLYEKGIAVNLSFIIGFPSETNEDLRMNIDLMLELKKLNPFVRGNIYFLFPLPKTQIYNEIKELYNVELPIHLSDLEEANFWVKNEEDPIGRKFRPWIDKDRFGFLVNYGLVFNNVFHVNNHTFNNITNTLLENNQEIKEMFKGINSVNRPKTDYRPYVLDRVLKEEEIDLVNDLKNK
jgi:anaerobic magnesium-protoporphyrin IX monomethyl ester cyclase